MKNLKHNALNFKLLSINLKSQRGVSLIEVLVAIAILGIIAAAFSFGLIASFKAVSKADELQTGRNIAEKQMEYVLNLPYNATSYTPLDTSADYPDYIVNIIPEIQDTSDIIHYQKITVVVTHDGKQVTTLDDYKLQR